MAEDGGGVNRIIGFTPEGESRVFALHNIPYPTLEEEGLPINFQSEVTGPTFSPDGETLFFNVQYPGTTFAVLGQISRAERCSPETDGCRRTAASIGSAHLT